MKPPYYGIWIVDEFAAGGPAGHAIFTDKLREQMRLQPGDERWKSLIFDRSKVMAIQCGNDVIDYVTLELDAAKKTAVLRDDADPQWKSALTFSRPGPQLLSIQGTVNGSEISAKLHRVDESKLPLTSRGFHFINEHPF